MEKLDVKSRLFTFVLKEIIRLRKTLGQRLAEEKINLKVDQFILLGLIYEKDKITQQEIADVLQKDKTIVLRQVKALIEDGYIVRQTDVEDGRKKNLMLTEEGMQLYKQAESLANQLSQNILQEISYEQIQNMELVFDKMANYAAKKEED